MAYEGFNYEPFYRWAYYGAIALIGLLLVLLRPMKAPPPPNTAAYGCYITEAAAPISLAKDGMRIVQEGFPTIQYHLERHKTGIALTADAPIEANEIGGRYTYSIRPPGEGWYLDFYKDLNGHRYGVFDQAELSSFTMLARDGSYLSYMRASADRCQPDHPRMDLNASHP